MKVQVLISSIDKTIEEFEQKTKNYDDLIIINQKPTKLSNQTEIKKFNKIKWINIDQKGLSRSRNYALEVADADVVYLSDDDIVLEKDFYEVVSKAFNDNPEYDILAFNIEGIEQEFKKEEVREKEVSFLTSMKLSSVQIVSRLDFIRKNNIYFDELFGAGSRYTMGEENIFLFDALKKGAKIKHIPTTIAKLHIGESTWFKDFDRKYLFDRGASYWRMFGLIAPLYSMTFCIRKRSLFKHNFGLLKAYYYMLKGMKDYLRNKNNPKLVRK